MANRTARAVAPAEIHPGFLRVHTYLRSDGSASHFKGKRVNGRWAQWHAVAGKRTWGCGPAPEVLYNRPGVDRALLLGQPIWITEGEKDADVLIGRGHVATTVDGGASSWPAAATAVLSGAKVLHVVLDNDAAGENRMPIIAEAFQGQVPLRFYLPARGNDLFDHVVGHGLSVKDLVPAVNVRRPSPSRQDQVKAYDPAQTMDSGTCASLADTYLRTGLAQIASSAGNRNNTLNRVAYFNFRIAFGNGLPLHSVEQALTSASMAVGLQQREIVATIKSAMTAAQRDPLRLQAPQQPKDVTQPTMIDAVVYGAHAAAWPGKGGRYRKKILLALTQIAAHGGGTAGIFIASRTMIMREADTPSKTSLEKALTTLVTEGWVQQVSKGSFTEAARWRLLVPLKYQSFFGFRCVSNA